MGGVSVEEPAVRMPGRRSAPGPFALVIFGATGDLTHRKLVPAVYSLFCEGLLPERFHIVAFARREMQPDAFRDELEAACRGHARCSCFEAKSWRDFASRIEYARGGFDDLASYRRLDARLGELAAAQGRPRNHLFYLATPPDFFAPIIEKLGETGLVRPAAEGTPWSRVVIEKPFGRDLESARELNRRVLRAMREEQVFRIDHYLGKETVQNILVLRFANSIFEPLWHSKYVDHVQITVAEKVGVETRGGYYDRAGALRDMVQNHMMHLLCLVAMESPISLDAQSVRDEKIKVLRALRPIPRVCGVNGVVRAQYGRGALDGAEARAYTEEEGVAADSATETYVAFKALVDNWRWSGVPFYLRHGKRLPARVTEISIHFKQVPQVLFNADPRRPMPPNVLTLRIQPDEGIALRFQAKVPGLGVEIRPLQMDFSYARAFGKEPPDAYERLILDAALGDGTLFTRSDEVEAAWEFVDPVVTGCTREAMPRLPTYAAGTWGPNEADDLIRADGREWSLLPCGT